MGAVDRRERDEVLEDFVSKLAAISPAKDAARGPAVEGLKLIVGAIRQNPGSGQTHLLVGFLGGLYNGPRFPFDMTDLRSLDHELAEACLDVLRFDHFGQAEVHTWGVIDGDELNELLQAHGHYYAAQQRRIGRELYQDQFGDQGHPDEGCCA